MTTPSDPPFHKGSRNHVPIYINMANVAYVEAGKGFCDVTMVGKDRVRLMGEDAARFVRRLERPETASEK